MEFLVTMLNCKECNKYVRPIRMKVEDDYSEEVAYRWECPDCGTILGWMTVAPNPSDTVWTTERK